MKKALSVIALTLMLAILLVSFTACGGSQNGEIVDVDYSKVLKDYLSAPDETNVDSIENGRDGAKEDPVNITAIYEDDTLSTTEKIAQMVDGATINEIACAYFAYFTNKVGSTNLGNNSGDLVYQRLRKQTDTVKDDTTIKLPLNHNFSGMASNFVTSATIRYVANGKYNRMEKKGDIKYDFKTGILEVNKWKKGSKWNKNENAKDSRSYDEARKSVINWEADGIVSAEGAKIEYIENNGSPYYQLTFSIDIEVANADSTTIDRLENDNGGSNMKFEYCNFVVQIWECGLAKRYDIEESWSGKIQMYSGSAKNNQTTVFSYSQEDMDFSATEAIYKSIAK